MVLEIFRVAKESAAGRIRQRSLGRSIQIGKSIFKTDWSLLQLKGP
jgi:hypothetical protein